MNKFFKRILPATILATCCTVSVFSMTACNEGKDYSEDFAKLQQQIDDQKNQINDLQNENNSLKDQISNITPGDTDYTEEIEKLQQQIEALKVQNASYLEESTKLKQQIETLKTNNESNLSEISKLETQLANLKTSNDSNLSEIEKLQQQIETLKTQNTQLTEQASNQQKLIESLQNAVNVEPKVYKVGETFTYSYQGIDYFTLKVDLNSENNWWRLTVRNLQMYDTEDCNYIGGFSINKRTNLSDNAFTVTSKIDTDTEYKRSLFPADNDTVKLIIGFPLQDRNIIPYAVFDLTSSD